MKNRILVWDLVVRLFHFLAGICFASAFLMAIFGTDANKTFAWHPIQGLLLLYLVLFRIFWGFRGSKYARFASFAYAPNKVKEYFAGVAKRKRESYTGHNPGSSYAIFAMIGLPILLVATGLLAGHHVPFAGDLHEVLAWLMVLAVAVHIAGVLRHTFVFRDGLILSMINGHKASQEGETGLQHSSRIAALFLLLIFFGLFAYLGSHYDDANRAIQLPGGYTVHLMTRKKTAP